MSEPTTIRFTVHGLSQPAGSKKAWAFRRPDGGLSARVSDDNAKSKPWKQLIASIAREAYRGPLLEGPILFIVRFYFPRPKGHFGKKGLKASAPRHKITKPDTLKLTRGAEDALTGVIWRDDNQVVRQELSKEFGEPARVEIEIRTLNDSATEVQADELPLLFGGT